MWEAAKRWRWAIGIAALLVLGLAYSFYPEAVAVDVEEVTTGPMAVGITDDGVTRVDDLYVVSAPVTGYVTRVEIEPGDTVVANDTVIARMAGRPSTPLDARTRQELQNALAAATAAERSAQASSSLARSELARAEELFERGFLSQSRLDAARSGAASASAAVDQARAEVRRIRASLAEPGARGTSGNGPVAVRSPESGVVLRVANESEGVVIEGTPLVEIGDPGRIEVVIDLLSREAVRVRPGARAEIARWGGDRPLVGRVQRIEPFGRLKISALGIEEQRVNVIIDFVEGQQDVARLGHGYQVDATIVLWREEEVARVPVSALFRGEDGGWRVYAVEGGRARERGVEIGHINDEHAELLGGLEAGATVIANPGNSVRDGSRVRARD